MNVIAEEAIKKLGLKTEPHPSPYHLAWLNNKTELLVSRQAVITFSIGSYRDEVSCDVVPMDACHLLLGRPWQYDRDAVHKGKNNTYSFVHGERTITLLPSKEPTATSQTLPAINHSTTSGTQSQSFSSCQKLISQNNYTSVITCSHLLLLQHPPRQQHLPFYLLHSRHYLQILKMFSLQIYHLVFLLFVISNTILIYFPTQRYRIARLSHESARAR